MDKQMAWIHGFIIVVFVVIIFSGYQSCERNQVKTCEFCMDKLTKHFEALESEGMLIEHLEADISQEPLLPTFVKWKVSGEEHTWVAFSYSGKIMRLRLGYIIFSNKGIREDSEYLFPVNENAIETHKDVFGVASGYNDVAPFLQEMAHLNDEPFS